MSTAVKTDVASTELPIELATERVVLANLPSSWTDADVQMAVSEQLASVGCGDVDVFCHVAKVGTHSTRSA
jgi:hypothetical protein